MAEPITQELLRALAAVHPDQGRVLSVFLNLDPTQFATPPARSSAITSVMTAAAHKVDEAEDLTHDDRVALDRTPCVEPLVTQGLDEQWLVLLSNRRAARLFVGTGDALEETDRLV